MLRYAINRFSTNGCLRLYLFPSTQGYEGSLLKVTSKNGKTASVSVLCVLCTYFHVPTIAYWIIIAQHDSWFMPGHVAAAVGRRRLGSLSVVVQHLSCAAGGFRDVSYARRRRSGQARSTGNRPEHATSITYTHSLFLTSSRRINTAIHGHMTHKTTTRYHILVATPSDGLVRVL